MVAHGQAGARLAVARHFEADVARAQLGEGLQLVTHGLAAIDFEQQAADAVAEADGRVGGGVDAAGNAGLDLADSDLVGDQDGGFETGAAGLLDVIGRGLRVEGGAEHAFAGQVEVTAVLENGTGDHFANALAAEVAAFDQTVEGSGEHVFVGGGGVDAVGAGERNAVGTDDGNAAKSGHEESPVMMAGKLAQVMDMALAEMQMYRRPTANCPTKGIC